MNWDRMRVGYLISSLYDPFGIGIDFRILLILSLPFYLYPNSQIKSSKQLSITTDSNKHAKVTS